MEKMTTITPVIDPLACIMQTPVISVISVRDDGQKMSTDWPAWARKLRIDSKWSKGVRALEIDGVEFLVVSRYGLDTSATIALVGDATEYDFRFQILPHPDDKEMIQVLVWKDSNRGDGRVSE